MQRLVPAVEDVDDREPPVLVFRRELELLAVVPCIGALAELLDVLDGDYTLV